MSTAAQIAAMATIVNRHSTPPDPDPEPGYPEVMWVWILMIVVGVLWVLGLVL